MSRPRSALFHCDRDHDAARDQHRRQERRLAKLLLATETSHGARVKHLYLRTLGRLPESVEMTAAKQFVDAHMQRNHAFDEWRVRENALAHLSLAVLNLNEFIYLD